MFAVLGREQEDVHIEGASKWVVARGGMPGKWTYDMCANNLGARRSGRGEVMFECLILGRNLVHT